MPRKAAAQAFQIQLVLFIAQSMPLALLVLYITLCLQCIPIFNKLFNTLYAERQIFGAPLS